MKIYWYDFVEFYDTLLDWKLSDVRMVLKSNGLVIKHNWRGGDFSYYDKTKSGRIIILAQKK